MTVKTASFLLALVVIGVLVYGLWYQRQYPRTIIGESTVRVESRTHPGPAQVLKTRLVEVNKVRFSEVELPNGTWIDCAGDCRKAALEAGPEFWDALARKGGR